MHAALCRGELYRGLSSLRSAAKCFGEAFDYYIRADCRWGAVRSWLGLRLAGRKLGLPEGLEKTRMTLNGCYRSPLGRLGSGLDRAVLHRVAAATIRALLRGIADTLAEPGHEPGHYQTGTSSTPSSAAA